MCSNGKSSENVVFVFGPWVSLIRFLAKDDYGMKEQNVAYIELYVCTYIQIYVCLDSHMLPLLIIRPGLLLFLQPDDKSFSNKEGPK